MIKKVVKNSMLFVLVAGALNIASAQEKSTAGKPTGTNLHKKKEGGNHGQLFDKLDVDKNGKISRDEAKNSNIERIASSFDIMDTNKDGYVTREELKSARHQTKSVDSKQAKKDTNSKVDVNTDGKISRDEANKSGSQYYIKNFDQLDTNKDGFISKEEKQVARAAKKAAKTTIPNTDK